MGEKGFVNHTIMGALFLGGMWFVLYLPNLALAARPGGWCAGLAIAAYALGSLGGPIVLVLVESDEFGSLLGLGSALLLGAVAAGAAVRLGWPPELQELGRLCAAALGPLLLFSGLSLVFRLRR
jgi:hypothetical protein